ncbi:MAG: head GIN domain-containing protein [Myxococcota bacterium]
MRALVLAALFVPLSGCFVLSVANVFDEEPQTQTRTVGEFDAIELEGAIDVEVVVGKDIDVEVIAAPKLLDDVTTKIKEGTLHIDLEGGGHSSSGGVLVKVAVPSLVGVELSGSGDIKVAGLTEGDFEAIIAGSGDVELAGTAESLTASIKGSGDIDARGLSVETADLEIAGSGDITATASQSVLGDIAGSGDITVRGGASCTVTAAGSGDVNC